MEPESAKEKISNSSNDINHEYKRHAELSEEQIDDVISAFKNKSAISEAISEKKGTFRTRRDIAHYLIKHSDPGGRVWITNPEADNSDDPNPYMPPPFGWADKANCVAKLATGPEAVWEQLQGIADACLDDKIRDKNLEAEIPCLCAVLVAMTYFEPHHRKTAHSLNRLGWSYVAKGELKLAEKMFTRALTAYEKCLGERHPMCSGILQSLVWLKTSKFKPNMKTAGECMSLAALEKRCLGDTHARS